MTRLHRRTLAPRRRLCVLPIPELADHGLKAELVDARVDLVCDQQTPDAVLVDLRSCGDDGTALTATIRTAQHQAIARPIVFLIAPDQWGLLPVNRLAARDLVVVATPGQKPLIRALQHAVLATDASDEYACRLRTMATLGFAPPAPQIEPPASRILVLAEPSADTLSRFGAIELLANCGMAGSRGHALQLLESDIADGLVIFADHNRRRETALLRLLRRHTELWSLPVVVIDRRAGGRFAKFWSEAGADAVLTADHLATAVALIQRRAQGRAFLHYISQLLELSVMSDYGETTALAACRYFDASMADRLQNGRHPVGLVAVRMLAKDGSASPPSLSEAAVTLAMAARYTDIVCRPAPDLLLVALPGSDEAGAGAMAQTFGRLLSDLKFGPKGAAHTFDAKTAATVALPGASLEEALSGILRKLSATGREKALA